MKNIIILLTFALSATAETMTITLSRNQTKYLSIPAGKVGKILSLVNLNWSLPDTEIVHSSTSVLAGPIKVRLTGQMVTGGTGTVPGLITIEIDDQKSPASGSVVSEN